MGHNSSTVTPLTQKIVQTRPPKQIQTLAKLILEKNIEKQTTRDSNSNKEAKLHSFGSGSFIVKCNRPFTDVRNISGYVEIYFDQSQNKSESKRQIFQGQLINGIRQNFGVQFDQNGKPCYQGTFKNNKYHGWGCTENYQGQWVNGMKQGWGVFQKKQGNQVIERYEGFWKQNMFHGMGSFNILSNEISNFIKGQKITQISKGEEMYIGQWENGKMHGCGKLVKMAKNSQQYYQGQFANGLYDGQGQLKIDNQPLIKGTFKNGVIVK